MSGPLVLTVNDLRHLADALEALNEIRDNHQVTPGQYDRGITICTSFGDDVSLKVSIVDDELVIDDRSGS